MTKHNEQIILERLNNIEELTSDDLLDLRPKTIREHLMIMFPTQQKMLKHLEEINSFREGIDNRVGRLETAFKVGGAIIITSLLGLALKVIFA